MEMSRFLYEVGFFICACAICNAAAVPRHPIERNYGNSVRFLAKIPNGTAAESLCYSVFWNAIDFCRLYTSKKNLNVGPANRPAFCRQVPLFTRNVPLKTFSRLAGLNVLSLFGNGGSHEGTWNGTIYGSPTIYLSTDISTNILPAWIVSWMNEVSDIILSQSLHECCR